MTILGRLSYKLATQRAYCKVSRAGQSSMITDYHSAPTPAMISLITHGHAAHLNTGTAIGLVHDSITYEQAWLHLLEAPNTDLVALSESLAELHTAIGHSGVAAHILEKAAKSAPEQSGWSSGCHRSGDKVWFGALNGPRRSSPSVE